MSGALLFDAVRSGSLAAVRTLIADGADVNKLSEVSECTPLHLAAWRNDLAMIEVLLEAGASTAIRDGESGWTPLHRCLHWGHLQAAALLLLAGASIDAEDLQGITPVGIIAGALKSYLTMRKSRPEVYSWGSGANYQLGTGSTGVSLTPCRIDSLHEMGVVQIAAAKYHSAAVTADGKLLTWGFGHGGRLGHPEHYIHSGERAVITPQQVTSLGRKQVSMVAVAKHHCVLATMQGEVFTWGSNRHGVLGYPSPESQATPRLVSSLRAYQAVGICAAAQHSAAVTSGGVLFTWGDNTYGQLGHIAGEGSSFHVPRMVDALKGKRLCQVAAAERHTICLTDEGDILQWGHGSPSIRRVPLAGSRDMARFDGENLVFHRGQSSVARPQASYVVAGEAFSGALTRDGVALVWTSWEASSTPAISAVGEGGGPLAGRRIVSLSTGHARMAVVTDDGEVFMWEGLVEPASSGKKAQAPQEIVPERVEGLRRVVALAVGDRHSLALQWWSNPWEDRQLQGGATTNKEQRAAGKQQAADELEESGLLFDVEDEERGSEGSDNDDDRLWTLAADMRAVKLVGGDSGYFPSAHSDMRSAGSSPPNHYTWGDVDASLVGSQNSRAQLSGHLSGKSPHSGSFHSEGLLFGTSPAMGSAGRSFQGGSLPMAGSCGSVGAIPSSASFGVAIPHRVGEGAALSGSLCTYGSLPTSGGWERSAAGALLGAGKKAAATRAIPTLEFICQRVVAAHLVEPRTALHILEYAELAGSADLATYCKQVAVCNLDAVLLEAPEALAYLSPHLLKELEDLLKALLKRGNDSEGAALWAPQPGLRPTAVPTVLCSSASGAREDLPETDAMDELFQVTAAHAQVARMEAVAYAALSVISDRAEASRKHQQGGGYCPAEDSGGIDRARLLRSTRKKLGQIRDLEGRALSSLDQNQRLKLATRPAVEAAVQLLETGGPLEDALSLLAAVGEARAGGSNVQGEASAVAGSVGGASSAGTPGSALSLTVHGQTGEKKQQRAAGHGSQNVPGMVYVEQSATALPPSKQEAVAVTITAGKLEITGLEDYPQSRRERSGKSRPIVPLGPGFRRGGLSMFLRGDLDAGRSPEPGPSQPLPLTPSPSGAVPWRAAESSAAGRNTTTSPVPWSAPSFRDIQLQEAHSKGVPSSTAMRTPKATGKATHDADATGSSPGATLSLADFLSMAPKARRPAKAPTGNGMGAPSPAWGGAKATPPGQQGASLLDIQAQQLKESGRTPPLPPGAQARGSSPPPKGAAGIQLPSSGMRGVSPSESKWFIPSAQAIVSLAAIQSEEAEAAAAVAAELAAAASLAAESGGQEKQRQEGPSRRRRGERKPEAELERGQWETRQGEAEGHPSPQLNPSQNRHRRPRQRKQPDADAAGGESERPQGEVEGEVPQQQAPFQNRQRRPRQRSSRPLKDNEGDAAGIKTPTGKATAKKANISPTHQGRGEKGSPGRAMNRGRSSGRGKSGAADCAQAGAQGQNTRASEDKQEGAGNENRPDSRGNHRQQSTRGRGGRGRGRGGRGSDGNQVIAAENAPLA